MEFYIHETNEEVKAKQRPIVIITSNAEKELPDAFLRRCVFHFIAFPEAEMMQEIIDVHHPELSTRLMAQCLTKFYWLRDLPDLRKRPSTSELLDWIGALVAGGIDPAQVEKQLPYMGVLLKKDADLKAAQQKQTRRGFR